MLSQCLHVCLFVVHNPSVMIQLNSSLKFFHNLIGFICLPFRELMSVVKTGAMDASASDVCCPAPFVFVVTTSIYRVAQNRPGCLLLLFQFCMCTTKHASMIVYVLHQEYLS